MLQFKSKDTYEIKGRGTAYIVVSPFDTPKLLNEIVEIDDTKYLITGIETRAIARGILKGDLIGLLVKKQI